MKFEPGERTVNVAVDVIGEAVLSETVRGLLAGPGIAYTETRYRLRHLWCDAGCTRRSGWEDVTVSERDGRDDRGAPDGPMTEVWDARSYDRSFGYVSDLGRGLIELLDPVPGERVLDLGCGTGELAADLAARGLEVIGIDADAAMIETARRNHPQVSFYQADGHDFSLPDPVDAVLSNAALHWMLRPHEVVARVRAALRPGGRFVGEFGGQGNVAAIREAVTDAVAAVGVDPASVRSPWYFPSPAEYAAVLEGAGFRVRLLEHFDRPTPLDDCPAGVVDWLRMFGRELLAGVPPDKREEVMVDAAQRCRATLYRDGRWFADYVRLRFVAQWTET